MYKQKSEGYACAYHWGVKMWDIHSLLTSVFIKLPLNVYYICDSKVLNHFGKGAIFNKGCRLPRQCSKGPSQSQVGSDSVLALKYQMPSALCRVPTLVRLKST